MSFRLTLAALAGGLMSSTGLHAAPSDQDLSVRMKAAMAAAESAPSCSEAKPFYWEIGDAHQVLASGRVGQEAPEATSKLQIASASKWIYSAYVVQRRNASLTADDVRFLNFRSGYSQFRMCRQGQTVQECQESMLNGRGKQDKDTLGYFAYSGGHMQQHAVLMGLGTLDNEGLAYAIKRDLGEAGASWDLTYSQPQLAGGAQSSAKDYGRFLRAVLAGELKIGGLLGTHAVCTNPKTCADAVKTPIPQTESWHYSLGHWVEDDPNVGDGAFSSPGAFGFYPWIDAGKQYYGIVAREAHKGILMGDADSKPAVRSVACGRAIRAAWAGAKSS